MTVSTGLSSIDLLTMSVFSGMPWISKSFDLPNFLASQSCDQIVQVVEIERHLFLRKQIITQSPNAHIKLDATANAKSHHFSCLLSSPLLSHSLFATPHPLLLCNGW
jgi:hypothetical protein